MINNPDIENALLQKTNAFKNKRSYCLFYFDIFTATRFYTLWTQN